MKKFYLATAAAAVIAAGGTIFALTGSSPASAPAREAAAGDDYTSYVVNSSFENFTPTDAAKLTEADSFRGWTVDEPAGWTIDGSSDVKKLIVNADAYSDNNFGQYGTISDGTYAMYLRMGWVNANSTLSQTLKNLPAGAYRLSCDYKTGYNGNATSSFTLEAKSKETGAVAFTAGSANFMPSNAWKTISLDFNNAEAGNVDIAINVTWVSGGSCIALDNFRLVRTGDASGTDPEPEPEPEVGDSPTEGVITHDFVGEDSMKTQLMQMLAKFSTYMNNNVQTISATNSNGEKMISFKGENTLGNNEQGVRHNADMSMICAYLVKYAKGKVTLPEGITWDKLEELAMQSLTYSYSTHRANKLYACKDNNYWGSTNGSGQWESSLWAMSVAYSAFFQWDKLTDTQKKMIEQMMVSECDYELNRTIPTGYAGDTKAEENGWEADILAATLGLFPNHENASKWFDRLREFAINSYSHPSDADNKTVIDPEYDNKTVADLYKGANLYEDWTLQNHNLFHTSYQNVVMQELGEAALALKLFQTGIHGTEKWKTNALMHNNQEVMDNVLNWLALADGELAMPNGNDWSLFLFDQITSYSTMACFLRDPNALFLENMAFKYIQARQRTTTDGSWLLRADVGGRRMGVEGHRVMMTALMHEVLPTADLTPVTWPEFQSKYSQTKYFPCQNVIRASSPHRFTTFSWSDGLSSYTGYIASHNPDNNKIIVPLRQNNTGNFLGWYTVTGKAAGAAPVVKGIYQIEDDQYVMNGELNVNSASLNHRFALYSTPGNAVIYLDLVRALTDCKITREQGGLMAISFDEFTKKTRKFYTEDVPAGQVLAGNKTAQMESDWANIDDELGFVARDNKGMALADQNNNNSITTTRFYPLFSRTAREVKTGETVDKRHVIYYTSVDAATTKTMRDRTQNLADATPEGWNGVIAPDPDGSYFLILANFASMEKASLKDITMENGAPVFSVPTLIKGDKASADFIADVNNSHADVLRAFVKGADVKAMQDPEDRNAIYMSNEEAVAVSPAVTFIADGKAVKSNVNIAAGQSVRVSVENGAVKSEAANFPVTETEETHEGYGDITYKLMSNPGFEKDLTYGKIENAKVGSTTYANAYVNDVDPIDATVPNILPVIDWENKTDMTSNTGNKPYRRMFSMPYSILNVIASPAGNFTASCAPQIGNARMGKRCLTVLNSWAKGDNRITKTFDLEAGEYRILATVKYVCPNQVDNDGKAVRVSSDNVNSSLTGVEYADVKDYRYPDTPDKWQTLRWDLNLEKTTPVTVSLGYNSSVEAGAANQTLMYIDDVRVLGKGMQDVDVVNMPYNSAEIMNPAVYTLDGVMVRRAGVINTEPLPAGIYVKGGKKIIVK